MPTIRNTRILIVLAAAFFISSIVEAGPLRLTKGFTPHPYETRIAQKRGTVTVASRRGLGVCVSGKTTSAPAMTFEVTQAMKGLNILFADKNGTAFHNAAVVTPTGSIACSKGAGNVFMSEAKPGVYKVFFIAMRDVDVRVRIEQPKRVKRTALEHLEKRAIQASTGALNPQTVALTPGRFVDVRNIGIDCGKGRISPLAQLVVKNAGDYYVHSAQSGTVITNRNGTCIKPTSGVRLQSSYRLDTGTYSLWAAAPRGKASSEITLEVDDLSRPYSLGEAESYSLADLSKPILMSGSTRPSQKWPARFMSYGCKGVSRAPDFYVELKRDTNALLELYRDKQEYRLHMYGPIDTSTLWSKPACDQKNLRAHGKAGTYAVWVRGKTSNQPFHVVARDKGETPDPMTSLLPIPNNPPLDERVLSRHYPYHSKTNNQQMLQSAPEQLFVFTTKAADAVVRVKYHKAGHSEVLSLERTLSAGEPLLVSQVRQHELEVVRFDGEQMKLPKNTITTKRPSRIALPQTIAFVPRKSYEEAVGWGVDDQDATIVDSVRAAVQTYDRCVLDYMKKKDPTFNKNYKLVHIRGRNLGKTTTDLHFKKAAKKCGERKIEKLEKKALAQINASRKKRQANQLRAMRKRFGL